jgi:hypothetical protein
MKSSDSISSRFASTLRDVKIFFSSCLSMHMVPVLFALILIVVADRKTTTGMADTQNLPTVETQQKAVPSIKNYVLLNPANMTQVVAIYKASRLVMNVIR